MSDDTSDDTSAVTHCMLHGYAPPCPLCTSSATIPVVTPAPPAAPDVAELAQRLREGVIFYMDGCPNVTELEWIMDRAADMLTRLAADLARVERERDEAMRYAKACEGLPDDALDGGWTAAGLSAYAKSLEADAARWRYLRNNMTYTDRGPFSIGSLMMPQVRRWYHDSPITGIDTLDAAIDAAIAARGG